MDYVTLFRSLPCLHLLLARDLTILDASDAYLRATMTVRDAIIGRPLFEVFPDNPDDLEATGTHNLRASLDRVLATGLTDVMAIQKYDIRQPEGDFEERYWSPVNSPVLDSEGKILCIVHRVEDVTEFARLKQRGVELEAEVFVNLQNLQKANLLLREANEELLRWRQEAMQELQFRAMAMEHVHTESQTIMDLAVDAILTIDEKGTVLSANRAVERIFGYSLAEVVGRNVNMLMPEPHHARHDGYLRNYLATGKAGIIGVGRQVEARRRDGSHFPAHLAVTEVNAGGKRRFTGFIRDISDVVRLRTEMRRRETEYAEREEAVRHTVAHEERRFLSRELHDSVSQALFGIVLGTQAALSAKDMEGVRESLDYVMSLAESGLAEMRALILELRPESLESEGLTGSLARQIRAQARRHGLVLHLELGDEPLAPIGVKHECYRIVLEAVQNVVKHANARNLTVRLFSETGRLELYVEDDGRGFVPAEVPPDRVGLKSMRERIEGLSGHLEIETGSGSGTRVRALVGLPAEREDSPGVPG